MLKVQMASSDERDRPLMVTDEYLQYLAGELREEWRDVVRHLKISEYTIFNIASDYRQNVKGAIYQMLRSWKQSKGRRATYEVLSEALSKASRSDLSTESNISHKGNRRHFAPVPIYRSMDDTVTDDVLMDLSPKLGREWKSIGRFLNLEESVLDYTCSSHVGNHREMSYQMFREWKMRNGRAATYRNLVKAFRQVNRTDLAEELEALKDNKRHFAPIPSHRSIDDTVTDDVLVDLAKRIGGERSRLARQLDMSDTEILDIERNHLGKEWEIKYRTLRFWKQKKGKGATYNVLAKALSDVDRKDLSDELREGNRQHLAPVPIYSSMADTVTDDVLVYLSSKLGREWKRIGRFLNLEDSVLDYTCSRYVGNQPEMSYHMFREWKMRNGRDATYRNLVKAFRQVNRTDLVDELEALKVASLYGSGDLVNLYSGQWEDDIITNFDRYKRLKNDISFMLTKDEYMQLAEFFKISSDQLGSTPSVIQSTRNLLFALEEKCLIHPSDVSALIKALSTLNTNRECYAMVVMYQNNIMEISVYDRFLADLSTHITLTTTTNLCKHFEFPYGLTEKIIASSKPGLSLLLELNKTGFVQWWDVKKLEDLCLQFQLLQAVAKVQEYQLKATEKSDIFQRITSLTMMDQKKMLFIECLKRKLKYWYDAMTPVPWKKSCEWRSTDLYVGNLLIFKDSNSTSRPIETDKKCKVQYNEIFSHGKLSKRKRIIVEGEPGCGKTMLTAQLGYDWSQGLLEDVDILVLLPLKFVGNKTLLQAINEFYIPSRIPLEENEIEEILSSPKERVGVLLDGLEEYFYHESSEVAQVFTENKHPEWKVVLTCRSNCATGLPETIPRLQIDLFGEEERNNYIEKLYKEDTEKQEKVKTAINNYSDIIQSLCSVPLLFVLAVHTIESGSTLEKDHCQRAGTFMQNMISTLTTKRAIQHEIDGPSTEHSLRKMLYLGEVAFNGIQTEGQQLYWQQSFLENNVQYAEEWIDSGVLVIEEDFGITAKKANRKDELKVKEPDAVPQQDDEAEKRSVQPSDSERHIKEQELVEEEFVVNYTLINEASSENVDKEPATAILTTTKHVPQMVKFLHRVVQEWFAAAYFSTMLKKCTNRDHYDEYVSEHLPQISPTDLHYVLRFSCFLHPQFCHTIINHLLEKFRLKDQSVPSYIIDCICLCFVEHHGSKDSDMEEVVAKVCKEKITIHSLDSRMLQSAKCALLHYASQSMITIEKVVLTGIVIDAKGNTMVLDHKIGLNVLETLRKVEVRRWDPNLKKNHCENVLKFLATGSDIKEIICEFPEEPIRPLLQETRERVMKKDISVTWIIGAVVHTYNKTTDEWQPTVTQQVASRDMTSGELKLEGKAFLEASARVTNRRCVLTVAGTGVELHIPPNAFQDQETERTVTLRIIPNHQLREHLHRFEDHCVTAVEILPNKKILLSAAKLVLPHCLKLRNPRYCDGQVFESHHTTGQQPDWENISKSASLTVFHKVCEISLKSFCWVQIELECGREVLGKNLTVYATGDQYEECNFAHVNVGYSLNRPGGDKIYKENKGDYTVTQYFMFPKEPKEDLQITLGKTIPYTWKAESSSDVIPYADIHYSLQKYCSFVLEKPSSESPTPLCLCQFKVSRGTECKVLPLTFKKTKESPPTENLATSRNPPSMDDTVEQKVILKFYSKLGDKWEFIGRHLEMDEIIIQDISSNKASIKEMSYQILLKWKQNKGHNATYRRLEKAFREAGCTDLAEELEGLLASATLMKGNPDTEV